MAAGEKQLAAGHSRFFSTPRVLHAAAGGECDDGPCASSKTESSRCREGLPWEDHNSRTNEGTVGRFGSGGSFMAYRVSHDRSSVWLGARMESIRSGIRFRWRDVDGMARRG